jgi:hypothetical protein
MMHPPRRPARRTLPNWSQVLAVVVIAAILLAACTTKDDEDNETPTAVPATLAPSTPSSAPLPSPTAGGLKPAATLGTVATVVQATLSAANGQTISDGICVATIPDGWVDDGTGHGTTLSGAQYVLFGGRLRSDDDWKKAVDLVKEQAKLKKDAKVSEGDDFVRVDLPNDGGFEYRVRLENRYCDFSVTGGAQPIPPEERVFWDAIIASLAPAA